MFSDDNITRAADLGLLRHDPCHVHQIASSNPFAFDERTFYVAGITDNEGMSKKVFKALRKHEILREDDTVDTHRIGPKFAHQLAVINTVRQREHVNMLFWWEEECHRLNKLVGEEEELNKMIEESEMDVAENGRDARSVEVRKRASTHEETPEIKSKTT